MQFIFKLDKKSLVGGICCIHTRLSYFINNVKNTEVLHDGSEQLTGCKEASSPHTLTSVTTWPKRQRVATLHHPITGWDSTLCYITAPFPQLEKKTWKLQLSNTELSPSEISLQPLKKMWESRQNKNLQTSHLWCWHGFFLVFSSVQEKKKIK